MARPRVLLLAARSRPEVVEVLDEIRTGIGKWAEAVAVRHVARHHDNVKAAFSALLRIR